MSHQILRIREQTERVAKNKNTKNTPRIPAAASYVCWLPRESTTARNPFPSRHSRADLPLNLWDKSIRRIRAGTQRSCHLSGIDRILYGRGAQNFREWISANGFPRMDFRGWIQEKWGASERYSDNQGLRNLKLSTYPIVSFNYNYEPCYCSPYRRPSERYS